MSNQGSRLGTRRLPTAADAFAAAAVSNWTQIDLPRKDYLSPNTDWATAANWSGNQVPGVDDIFIRHGGDVSITGTTGFANNLLVDEGSTLVVNSPAAEHALFVSSELRMGSDSAVTLIGGTLRANSIDNTGGGAFDFTDGKLSVELFDGNLVQQGGTLTPGQSAGATYIIGDYSLAAAATVEIELGGIQPAIQHDWVYVTGTAALAGELQLELIGGFVPLASDVFSALGAASIAGAFSNVPNGERLSTLDGMGSFLVHYGSGSAFDPTQVVLSQFLSAIALAGDYNGNGIVDAADYIVWRKTLGSSTDMSADGHADGVIDQADYNAWRANFGRSLAASNRSSIATVPEPSSVALTMMAVTFVVGLKRTRQSRAALRKAHEFDDGRYVAM